ncbi:MAG: AAA family ATPase [Nanoarchaeota archaeon]
MEHKRTLEDVAGLEHQKSVVHDSIILPRKRAELYDRMVKRPDMIIDNNTFLFYGPSGSGKTFLAQAIANEIGIPYKEAQATQFLNEYRGEGAKKLRQMYALEGERMFLIDEIDAIAKIRSGHDNSGTYDLVLQLNMVLDGPGSARDKITIFSTNREDLIDSAIMSRIPKDQKIYFPKPDEIQRYKIIEKHLEYHNHDIKDLSPLLHATEDYDGRQIKYMFRTARNNALKANRDYLTTADFNQNERRH